MTRIATAFDPLTLLRTREGAVDIIDVPELGFAVVEGTGSPEGAVFAQALQALFAVAYGAHFQLKRERGIATKVMPLEALWWAADEDLPEDASRSASGHGTLTAVKRELWRWQAMILQPEPIDADTMAAVVASLQEKKGLPGLGVLRYERWEEGRSAQVLHIGRYADEAPSIVRLHEGIVAAGYRPRGRHHEIYLGDPRRSVPEKLRTLLRQPVAPF